MVLTHFAADKRTEKVPGRFVFQTGERRQRDFRKSVWNLDANNTSFNNTCETLVMFVVLYFAIFKRTDNVSVPYFSFYSRQMLCASWFLGAFTRSFS